jgi:hypothetical protein
MEIGDWITLGAVIVALGIGVASILHTNSMQKRERKERLLNEIIEWAEDIRQSSAEDINPNKVLLDSPVMQISSQTGFLRLHKRYQDLNTRSAYMKETISKVFGRELLSALEKVIQELDNNIKILQICLTRKAEENFNQVEECKKSIDCCAENLIKEATGIKIRNTK